MYRYEVSYRDNGIIKNRGFGYKEEYERFLARIRKNTRRYTEIRTMDNTKPSEIETGVEKLGMIVGKRLGLKRQ